MSINRRRFLSLGASVSLAALSAKSVSVAQQNSAKAKIQAVAFDAFPIFDPRPVSAQAEKLFPGKGEELMNAWRIRQFEYTWLRVAAKHYSDFWKVTEDALVFAAKMVKLELPDEKRRQLMESFLTLKPWSDVPPALKSLKESGIRLAFLSNFTPNMLNSCIKSSGLEGVFEYVLSTDQAKTYKPDPLAYQLGIDTFKLKRENILFAAFAGWDASGAKMFGYPTFWVNRLSLPNEELGVTPDGTGKTLTDLVNFINNQT